MQLSKPQEMSWRYATYSHMGMLKMESCNYHSHRIIDGVI
jgi:hypothetical protein